METETTTSSEFPDGGKAVVEQILGLEEINKSKGQVCENHIEGVGKLTISVRSFEIEKL